MWFVMFVLGIIAGTLFWRQKEKKDKKLLTIFLKKYFEEEWLATGRNFTVEKDGFTYTVAEFAKPLPGPGWVEADDTVKVEIPIDGSRKPMYNEFFRLRLRNRHDPAPPDYFHIGCFLYAESTGVTQAR